MRMKITIKKLDKAMNSFHHRCLYPYVDYVLTSKEKQEHLDDMLKDKCLFYTDKPSDVVAKLSTAKVLYVYPDTFDQWTDILLFIHQKKPLPVKLMIFCDSDINLCNDHLDALFAFFGETEFWVQNWIGHHPRCTLLPIGTSNPILIKKPTQKESLLGISFVNNYFGCPAREEFFEAFQTNSNLLSSCFPKTTFVEYCDLVSKTTFHTCPMGEGYDTFRFWETLALGSVPVVKDHFFYEALLYSYPDCPLIKVQSWSALEDIVEQELPPPSSLPYLTSDFWVSKINQILE